MRLAIVGSVLIALVGVGVVRAGDEADIKPNAKVLESRFRVVKQRYDTGKRQYIFVLEAKVTSDQPCNFDASFQDADDKEVKAIKIEFGDGGRQTTKGEQYTATVKYPTRTTMDKVTQIIIKKSD